MPEVFNTTQPIRRQQNSAYLVAVQTTPAAMHGYSHSLDLCLPPLSVLVFRGMRQAQRGPV